MSENSLENHLPSEKMVDRIHVKLFVLILVTVAGVAYFLLLPSTTSLLRVLPCQANDGQLPPLAHYLGSNFNFALSTVKMIMKFKTVTDFPPIITYRGGLNVSPNLLNFVPTVTNHFCRNLHEKLSQPGVHVLARPYTYVQ